MKIPLEKSNKNADRTNVSEYSVPVTGVETVEAEKEHVNNSMPYLFLKRLFDIVFSGAVIIVAFIPSLILCLAIRLESPGCPIYAQDRVRGINPDGSLDVFKMYKFRSMHKDADNMLKDLEDQNEADGPLFKIKDDPRVTKIGKFIRKHSIDEFPQFLNVFAGQLTLVGPRPPRPHEVEQYDEKALKRLEVKPGLTGPWQTSSRSDSSFEDMVELDLEYIRNRSIATDIKFILKTVGTMIDGEGAY